MTGKLKPYPARVTEAAKAYVAAKRQRQRTCQGYCEMMPFGNGMCKPCRDEAAALQELERTVGQ